MIGGPLGISISKMANMIKNQQIALAEKNLEKEEIGGGTNYLLIGALVVAALFLFKKGKK